MPSIYERNARNMARKIKNNKTKQISGSAVKIYKLINMHANKNDGTYTIIKD